MPRWARLAFPLLLGAGGELPVQAAIAGCDAGLIAPENVPQMPRAITSQDLVELRDIGSPIGYPERESPFAVSPDGQHAAFQLRRADPAANAYCLGMVVIALRPDARPTIVDSGGDLIRISGRNRTLEHFPSGQPQTITPVWSHDGRWIAYLRRDRGITQVWRARIDGTRAEPATRSKNDILSFAWSPGDDAIIYTEQPAFGDKLAAIDAEGRNGFVYDDQFWPVASARPWPRGPIDSVASVVELADGHVRSATAAERALVGQPVPPPGITGAIGIAISADGDRIAWTAARQPQLYVSPSELHVRIAGHEQICASARCRGSIIKYWWLKKTAELLYLRYEGAAGHSLLGLYRWNPAGHGAPARILVTNDMLVGCELASDKLLCGRETALHPRSIVLIDPVRGAEQTVYDPNPEFSSLTLGPVRRLVWRNRFGAETFGDLVLPPGHRDGVRHPLIIVQYRSRGFLRGGMGDEYPIFVLAGHGFAVLSVDRPADYADALPLADVDAHTRANVQDWADRKNVFASIDSGIDLLDKMGVIDPHRIGISGMSDGASTVQFALVNSNRFAAAAVSSCCEDPAPSFSSVGPAYRDDLLRWGYPRPEDDTTGFWRQFSLVFNADKIRTPLLMQLPDDEFRISLDAYEALRSRNKPVELIVYPDEHHVKWQPAHRLAVYDRAVQWFDFWLQGRLPTTEGEQDRWCKLAKAAGANGSACSHVQTGDPGLDVH